MLHHLAVELGSARPAGLRFWARVAKAYFWTCGDNKAIICIRLGQHFHRKGWKRLARRMRRSLRREFSSQISFKAEIGPGLKLPHPLGIVIGEGVRLGAGVTIYQQVTFGGQRRGDWQAQRYPQVGDGVTVFAGARVIGPVRVGDRSVIGANAVVLRDLREDHVAVGVPAVGRPQRPRPELIEVEIIAAAPAAPIALAADQAEALLTPRVRTA